MFPNPQSKKKYEEKVTGDFRDIDVALFHSLGTQNIRKKMCTMSLTLIFTFVWLPA